MTGDLRMCKRFLDGRKGVEWRMLETDFLAWVVCSMDGVSGRLSI